LIKISKPNSGDDGFATVVKKAKVSINLVDIGLPGVQKHNETVDLD